MSEQKAGYSISYDRARKLLRLRLAGVWDNATLQAYTREYLAAEALASEGGNFLADVGIVIDLREYAVQTREVADALLKLMEGRSKGPNPCALIVSSSSLPTLQAKRISTSADERKFFTDEALALEWIAAEQVKRISA